VLAGAAWLAGEASAGESGVCPLEQREADARKVGVCDWICGTRTLPCATTTAPANYCTRAYVKNKADCDAQNRVFGGCYACSIAVNWKICDKSPTNDCTRWGSANQTCGFEKRAGCNWTGTACVCPGLPALFSANGCRERDCK